jgi:hypothetical protein
VVADDDEEEEEDHGLLRIVHPYESFRIKWDTAIILAMVR